MIRVYCRCSTEDQDLKSQMHEIGKWLKSQDETVEWYEDEGYSGLTLNRPGWTRLVTDLRPGDKLVCYAVDRVCRDLMHFLTVVRQLQARKVTFFSLREAVDISTPFGEAMLEILAVFGKLETRIRQSRQRSGIEARRDPETKRCPWGGRKPGTRVKVTVEKEDHIVKIYTEGQSVAAIARLVGLTRKTVYAILKRQPQLS